MVNPRKPTGIQAVVFDWAGTVIDFGSQAPMGAFVELFRRYGVAVTVAEARVPMGLPKWEHIQALGSQPRIAAQWARLHGHPFADTDVDRLYEEFTPMNALSVQQHAALIPGTLDTVAWLAKQRIRYGSTTGYNREIMAILAPLARAQGFVPENLVCAGDLPESRPSPLGMQQSLRALDVEAPWLAVKVDDTVPGLLEGRNAGSWTVGILATGNALGLTEAEWALADEPQRASLRLEAQEALHEGQADCWIDSVADLPDVIKTINRRLKKGKRPGAP
jgi:phosphonoacetaldehyde hydrolase